MSWFWDNARWTINRYEITVIPELLKMLAISGSIIAINVIGTQPHIAQTIIEAQADYMLSVKENQGHLYEDTSVLFTVDQAQNFKYASFEHAETTNKNPGRIEVRECWSTSNPEYLNLIRGLNKWTCLQTIAMVMGTRILDGKETKHVLFYISSLPSNAKGILEVVRQHWSIANQLHWVLDVALNEDHNQVRKDHAPLKTLRSCAILPSTCSNRRKLPKVASTPNNCRLGGGKIVSSNPCCCQLDAIALAKMILHKDCVCVIKSPMGCRW